MHGSARARLARDVEPFERAGCLFPGLSELVDASSVGGSTFDLGSATYDMTRIVTGQLDAYIEPGPSS